MAEAAISGPVAPERQEAAVPATEKPGRLLSLDVFRGATIVAMILVNTAGGEAKLVPLTHADWHGLTLTDLIFPSFMFIVGVSMAFSFGRRLREQSIGQIYGKILFRSLALIGIGIFIYNYQRMQWGSLGWSPASWMMWSEDFRITGVLNRIGFCYFFAAVAVLHFGRPRPIVAITAALLIGYWILMVHVPFEGKGTDPWARGEFHHWFNMEFMNRHWQLTWNNDANAFISLLPGIANILIGFLGGLALRRRETSAEQKTITLMLWGLVLVLLGMFWAGEVPGAIRQLDLFMPINKKLWTSSFTLLVCGLGLSALAACYWLIDVRGWRMGTAFCVAFGTNAILAYVAAEIYRRTFGTFRWIPGEGESMMTVRTWVHTNLVEPYFNYWLQPYPYVLFLIVVLWLVLRELHKRKIYLRL